MREKNTKITQIIFNMLSVFSGVLILVAAFYTAESLITTTTPAPTDYCSTDICEYGGINNDFE